MVEYTFSLLNFEYWLLVLVRISSFMFVAPFFSQRGVPSQAKIGLACFTAILVYGVVPHPTLEYTGMIGFSVVVLKEGITGLLIGFVASICNSIVLLAGNMTDMDIGLSMATLFDSDLATQMTLTGSLYYYVVFALLIISDMHLYILRAICDSFYVVPIGGLEFVWDNLLVSMVRFMTDLFVIAFRIFLPVFACMMVLNCILGIMAKVAPQMNMFSIGMQLKVLVGYAVLFFTVFLFPRVADMIFQEIKTMVVLFVEGMYGS